VVFSVHRNGRATCQQADHPFSYIWNFTQYWVQITNTFFDGSNNIYMYNL
jgi:hypothetical protein